ncbi:MAG: T9SS type A sorting domain-containing protein [Chitinophagales bacterium]|nr:T9SS type A sorting domain-containing protein [Chitinophagales bacterium]
MMILSRKTLAFSIACMIAGSLAAQNQKFAVAIDRKEAAPNQVVCVPVFAQGFDNILSYQYSLSWNANVLKYDHTQNYQLPGLTATSFNLVAPNRLLVGWADPSGKSQSKPDGAVLAEVCFKAISIVGTSTEITAGSEGFHPSAGGAEAYNAQLENAWNPNLSVAGSVEIVEPNATTALNEANNKPAQAFQMSPNPTSAGSRISFKAAQAGQWQLMVTDATGRTVYEQPVSVKAGENYFDIPATALKMKGAYQVSLKNGQEVSSQILSVQ